MNSLKKLKYGAAKTCKHTVNENQELFALDNFLILLFFLTSYQWRTQLMWRFMVKFVQREIG
jgi:hypothetical protein